MRSSAASQNRAHCGAGCEFGLLRDVTQPGSLAGCHLAAVGLDLAGENAKQGRLTRTIGSDQTDAGALFDGEGDVAQKRVGPE